MRRAVTVLLFWAFGTGLCMAAFGLLAGCGGPDPRRCYDPYLDCVTEALVNYELTQSTEYPDSPEDFRYFAERCYAQHLTCLEHEQ